jgi:hypothetical protein
MAFVTILIGLIACGREEPPVPAPPPAQDVQPTPTPTPSPTPRPTTVELGEGMVAEVLSWGSDERKAALGDTVVLAPRIFSEGGELLWQGELEYVIGNDEFGYAGLARTVIGMAVGEKRRTSVPKNMAWTSLAESPMHHVLEVELLELKPRESP